MATFSTSNRSAATVTAEVGAVWDVLTDPALIARLTPSCTRCTRRASTGSAAVTRIPVLGKSFSFTFRERMSFEEPHRIDFTHDPAPGREAAGVVGWYALALVRLERTSRPRWRSPSTCRSSVVRPAVVTAMKGVIALMGQRFSHNLLSHLRATTT